MITTVCADDVAGTSIARQANQLPPFQPGMGRVAGRYFEAAPFAFCILDRTRHVVFVNGQMAAIAGCSIAELDGACVTALFPQTGPMLERCYRLAANGKALPDARISWKGRSYLLTFSATYGADGQVAEMLIGAADISREARIEDRLRQSRRHLLWSLHTDYLTGLLNRKGLASAINRDLRRGNRDQSAVALLLIDVDYFKGYNDCFGHLAGDRCLAAIAEALSLCGRQGTDSIGRFGGEEFLMVLPDTGAGGALRVAENCRLAVRKLGIDHPESPFGMVTVSVGVTAIAGERGQTIDSDRIERYIEAADRALYEAKDAGRNTMRFCAFVKQASAQ